MLENINVFCHSSIKFNKEKIIYVDPFKIEKNYNDADIILITHSHYDHFSEEDILKVKTTNTVICITEDLYNKTLNLGFNKDNIVIVRPYNNYNILGIEIKTIPAYNINKHFHPKQNNWVGYIIDIENSTYYIAGDTDITEENKKVKCDVAFVPVGGTYTMTSSEAAELVNIIKPKIAVPIHYGLIVGSKKDAIDFKEKINSNIDCEILIK